MMRTGKERNSLLLPHSLTICLLKLSNLQQIEQRVASGSLEENKHLLPKLSVYCDTPFIKVLGGFCM